MRLPAGDTEGGGRGLTPSLRVWAGAVVAILVALATLVVAAAPASAHALAQSSDPAPGATLAKAPTQVTIVFGEQPDADLSSIRVLDTGGTEHQQGKAHPVAGNPLALTVAVGPLANGVYTVAWRTVSAVDGHLASGSFAFGVGVSPGAASATSTVKTPGAPTAAVVARWVLDAGVIVLLGTAVVALLAGGLASRRVRFLLTGSWIATAAGIVALSEQQRRAAGVAIGDLMGSSLGREVMNRALPALVALVAVLAVVLLPWKRIALAATALGALGVLVGDVLDSHTAASRHLRTLRMADLVGHVTAVSMWIGGLVALLVILGSLERALATRTVTRFSNLALVLVFVVAATGTQRALDEVGSWQGLFHTAFGRWVLVKIVVLVLLVGLGAVNRFKSVPALAAGHRSPLRRVATAELGLAAVALVATGFLQSLAPPATVARAATVKPLVVSGQDFATSVRVRLAVSPGTAGFNHFDARVVDYDTAQPVVASVSMRFSLPAQPSIGESTLAMTRAAGGDYVADGANLSIDGTWQITMLVQRDVAAVEVPLQLTTRVPVQTVDVSRSPGLPTVYTVHVSGGRSLQLYLDPGRTGSFNEFHFTPIGADGQEIPMTALAVTATDPDGKVVPVTVRRLDDIGHYVADLPDPQKGDWHFAVTATTATGEVLHTAITIPVA